MKVSVVMATYNGGKYVEAQLESLANQTLRPDEIIVADDNSTDATVEIVEAFLQRTAVEGVVLRNETGSPLRPPTNFGKALMRATGDIVFCCDQDDEWDPAKLATACAALRARPALAAFLNNTRFCDGHLRPTGLDKLGQIRGAGLPDESFVMGCCAAFRKSFLDLALPIPAEITHDGWLIGLCDLLGIVERSDQVLQSYRIHEGNVSKGFFINAAGRSSRLAMVASKLRAALSGFASNDALLRELVFVTEAAERLASRKAQFLDAYPGSGIATALSGLAERRRRLEYRKTIRMASLGHRLELLLRGFGNGCYSGPGGLLNAAKDALVRLQPSERFHLWPR